LRPHDTARRKSRPRDRREPGYPLARETAERHGGIDILVANAGVGAYGPFLDLRPDQLEEEDRRERGGDALRRPRDAPRATDFAPGRGRTPEMPQLAGMMSSEDVAEVVVFVVTRPRSHRILETAFGPMTEESWG
jgi:NADP-dependent 3-hydroxy acid dehydrogenase YdfG